MKEESRIVELLAKMAYKQGVSNDDVKEIKGEIVIMRGEIRSVNLPLKELKFGVTKMAEEIILVNHEMRILASKVKFGKNNG